MSKPEDKSPESKQEIGKIQSLGGLGSNGARIKEFTGLSREEVLYFDLAIEQGGKTIVYGEANNFDPDKYNKVNKFYRDAKGNFQEYKNGEELKECADKITEIVNRISEKYGNKKYSKPFQEEVEKIIAKQENVLKIRFDKDSLDQQFSAAKNQLIEGINKETRSELEKLKNNPEFNQAQKEKLTELTKSNAQGEDFNNEVKNFIKECKDKGLLNGNDPLATTLKTIDYQSKQTIFPYIQENFKGGMPYHVLLSDAQKTLQAYGELEATLKLQTPVAYSTSVAITGKEPKHQDYVQAITQMIVDQKQVTGLDHKALKKLSPDELKKLEIGKLEVSFENGAESKKYKVQIAPEVLIGLLKNFGPTEIQNIERKDKLKGLTTLLGNNGLDKTTLDEAFKKEKEVSVKKIFNDGKKQFRDQQSKNASIQQKGEANTKINPEHLLLPEKAKTEAGKEQKDALAAIEAGQEVKYSYNQPFSAQPKKKEEVKQEAVVSEKPIQQPGTMLNQTIPGKPAPQPQPQTGQKPASQVPSQASASPKSASAEKEAEKLLKDHGKTLGEFMDALDRYNKDLPSGTPAAKKADKLPIANVTSALTAIKMEDSTFSQMLPGWKSTQADPTKFLNDLITGKDSQEFKKLIDICKPNTRLYNELNKFIDDAKKALPVISEQQQAKPAPAQEVPQPQTKPGAEQPKIETPQQAADPVKPAPAKSDKEIADPQAKPVPNPAQVANQAVVQPAVDKPAQPQAAVPAAAQPLAQAQKETPEPKVIQKPEAQTPPPAAAEPVKPGITKEKAQYLYENYNISNRLATFSTIGAGVDEKLYAQNINKALLAIAADSPTFAQQLTKDTSTTRDPREFLNDFATGKDNNREKLLDFCEKTNKSLLYDKLNDLISEVQTAIGITPDQQQTKPSPSPQQMPEGQAVPKSPPTIAQPLAQEQKETPAPKVVQKPEGQTTPPAAAEPVKPAAIISEQPQVAKTNPEQQKVSEPPTVPKTEPMATQPPAVKPELTTTQSPAAEPATPNITQAQTEKVPSSVQPKESPIISTATQSPPQTQTQAAEPVAKTPGPPPIAQPGVPQPKSPEPKAAPEPATEPVKPGITKEKVAYWQKNYNISKDLEFQVGPGAGTPQKLYAQNINNALSAIAANSPTFARQLSRGEAKKLDRTSEKENPYEFLNDFVTGKNYTDDKQLTDRGKLLDICEKTNKQLYDKLNALIGEVKTELAITLEQSQIAKLSQEQQKVAEPAQTQKIEPATTPQTQAAAPVKPAAIIPEPTQIAKPGTEEPKVSEPPPVPKTDKTPQAQPVSEPATTPQTQAAEPVKPAAITPEPTQIAKPGTEEPKVSEPPPVPKPESAPQAQAVSEPVPTPQTQAAASATPNITQPQDKATTQQQKVTEPPAQPQASEPAEPKISQVQADQLYKSYAGVLREFNNKVNLAWVNKTPPGIESSDTIPALNLSFALYAIKENKTTFQGYDKNAADFVIVEDPHKFLKDFITGEGSKEFDRLSGIVATNTKNLQVVNACNEFKKALKAEFDIAAKQQQAKLSPAQEQASEPAPAPKAVQNPALQTPPPQVPEPVQVANPTVVQPAQPLAVTPNQLNAAELGKKATQPNPATEKPVATPQPQTVQNADVVTPTPAKPNSDDLNKKASQPNIATPTPQEAKTNNDTIGSERRVGSIQFLKDYIHNPQEKDIIGQLYNPSPKPGKPSKPITQDEVLYFGLGVDKGNESKVYANKISPDASKKYKEYKEKEYKETKKYFEDAKGNIYDYNDGKELKDYGKAIVDIASRMANTYGEKSYTYSFVQGINDLSLKILNQASQLSNEKLEAPLDNAKDRLIDKINHEIIKEEIKPNIKALLNNPELKKPDNKQLREQLRLYNRIDFDKPVDGKNKQAIIHTNSIGVLLNDSKIRKDKNSDEKDEYGELRRILSDFIKKVEAENKEFEAAKLAGKPAKEIDFTSLANKLLQNPLFKKKENSIYAREISGIIQSYEELNPDSQVFKQKAAIFIETCQTKGLFNDNSSLAPVLKQRINYRLEEKQNIYPRLQKTYGGYPYDTAVKTAKQILQTYEEIEKRLMLQPTIAYVANVQAKDSKHPDQEAYIKAITQLVADQSKITKLDPNTADFVEQLNNIKLKPKKLGKLEITFEGEDGKLKPYKIKGKNLIRIMEKLGPELIAEMHNKGDISVWKREDLLKFRKEIDSKLKEPGVGDDKNKGLAEYFKSRESTKTIDPKNPKDSQKIVEKRRKREEKQEKIIKKWKQDLQSSKISESAEVPPKKLEKMEILFPADVHKQVETQMKTDLEAIKAGQGQTVHFPYNKPSIPDFRQKPSEVAPKQPDKGLETKQTTTGQEQPEKPIMSTASEPAAIAAKKKPILAEAHRVKGQPEIAEKKEQVNAEKSVPQRSHPSLLAAHRKNVAKAKPGPVVNNIEKPKEPTTPDNQNVINELKQKIEKGNETPILDAVKPGITLQEAQTAQSAYKKPLPPIPGQVIPPAGVVNKESIEKPVIDAKAGPDPQGVPTSQPDPKEVTPKKPALGAQAWRPKLGTAKPNATEPLATEPKPQATAEQKPPEQAAKASKPATQQQAPQATLNSTEVLNVVNELEQILGDDKKTEKPAGPKKLGLGARPVRLTKTDPAKTNITKPDTPPKPEATAEQKPPEQAAKASKPATQQQAPQATLNSTEVLNVVNDLEKILEVDKKTEKPTVLKKNNTAESLDTLPKPEAKVGPKPLEKVADAPKPDTPAQEAQSVNPVGKPNQPATPDMQNVLNELKQKQQTETSKETPPANTVTPKEINEAAPKPPGPNASQAQTADTSVPDKPKPAQDLKQPKQKFNQKLVNALSKIGKVLKNNNMHASTNQESSSALSQTSSQAKKKPGPNISL